MALGFDSGVAVEAKDSGVAVGLDAEVLGDAPESADFDEFEPTFDDLASTGDEVAELRPAELLLLAVGEPLRLPVWVAAFFCDADLRFASGAAFDRSSEHYVKFVSTLLDVRRGAGLQPKRDDGAVTGLLCLYVGKTSTANGLGARDFALRNSHVEAIATAIGFIIVQRLIRA